jgi:UbiD family decarboxylase
MLTDADTPSLRSFLDGLPESDVLRVADPVELDYLPTALVVGLEKRRRAPVVLIQHPIGYDCPVVTNLFGCRNRIARMVGDKPGEFNTAWVRALSRVVPPVMVSRWPVHERTVLGSDVDAGQLPISRHYERDAGRYIGSGILVCKDPDTGTRNLSYQRLQLKGPNLILSHCRSSQSARHLLDAGQGHTPFIRSGLQCEQGSAHEDADSSGDRRKRLATRGASECGAGAGGLMGGAECRSSHACHSGKPDP